MQLKDQGYEAKGTRMDTDTTMVAEVDRVADTADTFRKSDQMFGQTFNDVGDMSEDTGEARGSGGVYRVKLTHEKK